MTLSMTSGKLSGTIFTFLMFGFVVGLSMSGCDGSGNDGGSHNALQSRQLLPPNPTAVFIEGHVHDGERTPLSDASCHFVERQSGQDISYASADDEGAFLLILPVDVTGFLRCHPGNRPQLALSAYITTQGQVSGARMIEDVTPASTVIADNIVATNALDPVALKAQLQRNLVLGDPDLMALVDTVRILFNAMVDGSVDSTADFSGEGDSGSGGADGGGAGGEAGDGGEFSPISGAVCTFSQDRDGLVRANTALADLFADGRVDRTDLQPIADQVNTTIDAEQRRAITRAFAKLFPSGIGQPISTIADGPTSATPGHFFLPLPAGVPGVIRCHPSEQENLVFDTCVRARTASETLLEQDVTPGTSVICGLVTETQQADPRTDREVIKNNLQSRLDPLLIFLAEDRNGNGVQDADEWDKNGDNMFSTLVELESLEPLTDDNRDLALLVSTATTIFDTMRIQRGALFDDRTFEEARRDFFSDAQFEADFFALEPDVVDTLDAADNLAVLGTNDVVGAATTGIILGTVTDADGTPVPDVRIELSQAAIPIGDAVVTDIDGRFSIANIPVGDTTITALKDGFQLLRVTTAVVAIVNIDLELRPTPQIDVSPSGAIFGLVQVGSIRSIPVRIANIGAADLTISDITINAASTSGYTFGQQPALPATLTPGSEIEVEIRYQPQAVETNLGKLIIDSDAEDKPVSRIKLVGSGTPQPVPQIAASESRLRFGKVEMGASRTRSIVLRNKGTAILTISNLTIAAEGSADFTLIDPPTLPVVLSPESAVRVRLRYRPSTAGPARSAWHIDSDATNARRLSVSLHGQGEPLPTPQIEASTNVLSFGEVEVRQAASVPVSVTKSVELFNTGRAPLTITALRVESSQGQSFQLLQAITLPLVVTPGSSVPIDIVYKSITIGSITGRVRVRSNADNTPELTIGLRATGVPKPLPQLALSAEEVSFGDVEVGQTRSRSVVLSNTGTGPLSISALGINPLGNTPFALNQALQVPFTIAPGAEVTLPLRFTPQRTGSFFNVLRITSDTGAVPTSIVSLSGAGTEAPTPELTLNDLSVMFGDVQVGMSRSHTIDLNNSGTANLVISAMILEASAPGAFALVNAPSLPMSLPPGAVLPVKLRYHPPQVGPTTGTLQIEHNGSAASESQDAFIRVSRQTGGANADTVVDIITLNGTGTPMAVPVIEVRPSDLSFGEVPIGTSQTEKLSITNSGSADLTLSGLAMGPDSSVDFALLGVPALPIVVKPSATFEIDVIYQPTAPESVTGTVEVLSDDANDPTIVVSLSGTGESVSVAKIDVQPGSLLFGDVEVGKTRTQTVMVTNVGTANLTVTNWNLTGTDFSLVHAPTLPTVIMPGMDVSVDILYQPMAVSSTSGMLEIVSNAANEPTAMVALSGKGLASPTAQIEVKPMMLGFGDVEIGASQAKQVTLRNVGTAVLTVSDIAVSDGDFTLGPLPKLPLAIEPNDVVDIELIYEPTDVGFVTGTLEILSDAANESSVVVSMNGTGQVVSEGRIAVQPTVLAFDDVENGSSSSQRVSIRNTGTADVTVSNVSVTGADFHLGQTPELPALIEPGTSIDIEVIYQPSSSGPDMGSLIIQSDVADEPQVTIDLSGTGQASSVPQIDVEPTELAFGDVELGNRQSETVTIRNVGTSALAVSNVSVTGDDYTLSDVPNLPAMIEPDDAIQVDVVYQPSEVGSVMGTLSIRSDAADNSQLSIDLSGTGKLSP